MTDNIKINRLRKAIKSDPNDSNEEIRELLRMVENEESPIGALACIETISERYYPDVIAEYSGLLVDTLNTVESNYPKGNELRVRLRRIFARIFKNISTSSSASVDDITYALSELTKIYPEDWEHNPERSRTVFRVAIEGWSNLLEKDESIDLPDHLFESACQVLTVPDTLSYTAVIEFLKNLYVADKDLSDEALFILFELIDQPDSVDSWVASRATVRLAEAVVSSPPADDQDYIKSTLPEAENVMFRHGERASDNRNMIQSIASDVKDRIESLLSNTNGNSKIREPDLDSSANDRELIRSRLSDAVDLVSGEEQVETVNKAIQELSE